MNHRRTEEGPARCEAKSYWRHWRVCEDLRSLQPYWNALVPDPYVASGARLRRYAVARYGDGILQVLPAEPHVQSPTSNRLFGGIERYFCAIDPDFFDEPALQEIVRQATRSIPQSQSLWHLQLHQFRILAPGAPTPEGVHCDGVDYVLMVLLQRHNISGGFTSLFGMAGDTPLAQILLTGQGEALLLDDRRMRHYVSPIERLTPEITDCYRDMLVITFHDEARSPRPSNSGVRTGG